MVYQANTKYMKPRVEKQNKEYAYLLLQDYAGQVSEDTAIHLYLFQHLVKEDELEEFAKIMENISIVEMHHLELLGETIKLLGVDPIYKVKCSNDDTFIPWNADYVDYTTDYKKMLEIDIKSEQQAIKNYTYHRNIINDKYIKQLLNEIIQDEYVHLAIFKELYNKQIKK